MCIPILVKISDTLVVIINWNEIVLPIIKVNYMTQNSWNDDIFSPDLSWFNKQIWVYCLTLPEK